MKIPFVDLRAQYREIKCEIDPVVQEVIREASFIGGEKVSGFEKRFSDYLGVKHCVGVGNGTDAIFIALKLLGIGTGDEVITVANSFIATSEAISRTGAKVIFVDCCEKTYNIDLNHLENKITKKTKAIVPVHIYGQPVDMDELMEIAERHGLPVVEDSAQAHGAQFKRKSVGSIGKCGCFSFYPGKNLGAYGDAGAIVTNDDDLAKNIRMFANHGRKEKYDHSFEGINSRLDAMQAAILNVKLPYLEKWTEQRRTIARKYDEGLRGVVTIPKVLPDVRHVYHLYVVRVKNRDKVRNILSQKGISTGIHYPIPLPFLEAYSYLGHKPSEFPVAFSLKDEILSLPMHGSLTCDQADYVINRLKEAVSE